LSIAVEEPEAPPVAPADEWVSARQVGKITGLPEKKVPRAAELGLLTVLRPVPGLGGLVRYGRASAEALAASRVIPARTSPSGPIGV